MLKYTVTEEAYIQFNLYHMTHSPPQVKALRRYRFGIPVIFLIFCAVLAIISNNAFSRLFALFLGCGVSLLWLLWFPYSWRRQVRRSVKRLVPEEKNEFIGDYTLELFDNFMRETAPGRSTDINYSRIAHAVRNQGHLYIYSGAVTASIIPVDAFAGEEELEAFLEELRQRKKKALAAG